MSLNFAKTVGRIAICMSALTISAQASAQDLTVDINRTQVLYLPTIASAVVIGNPEIADISVHSADTLFIVGRGYGQTNLIVLDQTGQKIMDSNITVSHSAEASAVRVLNIGNGRETYSCTPYCAPAPVLGDAPEFVGTYSGGAVQINNAAATGPITSAAAAQMSGMPAEQQFRAGDEFAPNGSSARMAQPTYQSRPLN